MGYYATIFKCVSCKKALAEHERKYNHGTCPKCGHRDNMAVTFVECIAVAGYFEPWYERGWKSVSRRVASLKFW